MFLLPTALGENESILEKLFSALGEISPTFFKLPALDLAYYDPSLPALTIDGHYLPLLSAVAQYRKLVLCLQGGEIGKYDR